MDIIDDGTCFACGHENVHGLHLAFDLDAAKQTATTQFTISPAYSGWKNAAHGGIVSTLLDEVMVYACGSIGWLVATGRLAVRFRHPVPVNTPLDLRGEVTRQRAKLINVSGTLSLNGKILADAQSTMAAMRLLTTDELNTMRAIRSFTVPATP